MKKLILIALIFPFGAKAQFKIVNNATINLVELRDGDWPITLQRITKDSDTSFVLLFRNQMITDGVAMTTFRFRNMRQLKYLQEGLSALKGGSNGDMAKYQDYSIKRVDIKKEGIWYVLNCNEQAVTNFQQPEADKLIEAIVKL
ncbi:MAG: hypothetical protein JST47_14850 [Bacteroidetes bacterium]|nr:hypothetical protein [Bacteroidota bacterium]MBS1974255.1 hypothetical protein [Bacteroidota bacterium]